MDLLSIGYAIYQFAIENLIATVGISAFLAFILGMWFKSAFKSFFGWLWMVVIFFIIMFLVACVLALILKPDILTSIIGGVIFG